MFLHIGWLHLIGNMWFLWLAGFILEERWGRVIYPIFYLLAGIAASLVHTISDPSSIVPALGASGAVAALMGGFLARFPKLKIHMLWYMLIFRVRFKAPAYWLLPLWLLMEVFYGSLFGQASGIFQRWRGSQARSHIALSFPHVLRPARHPSCRYLIRSPPPDQT